MAIAVAGALAATPASAGATASAPSAASAAAPECTASQLRFEVVAGGVGTGQSVAHLRVSNVGAACQERGFLGLSLVDSHGRTLLVARRSAQRAPTVQLRRNGSAYVELDGTTRGLHGDAGTHCVTPAGFRIYAPDQRRSTVLVNLVRATGYSWSTCEGLAMMTPITARA